MATSEVKEVDNKEVVDEIVAIKLNPDLPNGYRMLTRNLQMVGYYINHKKVYRLMFLHMLLEGIRLSKYIFFDKKGLFSFEAKR